MRRSEKEITDIAEMDTILKENRFCRIALSDNNRPYLVPMNYGYDGERLYLHCAEEGRKMDIIRKNPSVCFEVTDSISIVEGFSACGYGTAYRSVIGFGRITILYEPVDKRIALLCIMNQTTGDSEWDFTDDAVDKVTVLEVAIDSMTGKRSG